MSTAQRVAPLPPSPRRLDGSNQRPAGFDHYPGRPVAMPNSRHTDTVAGSCYWRVLYSRDSIAGISVNVFAGKLRLYLTYSSTGSSEKRLIYFFFY